MNKGIKTALIVSAGCIVAGGILMGAGKAAGGESQLAYVENRIGNGYLYGVYGFHSLPGLGLLERSAEHIEDIWERWADRFDDKVEERADDFADQIEEKADTFEQKVEAMEERAEKSGSQTSGLGWGTVYTSGHSAEKDQEIYNGDFDVAIAYDRFPTKLEVELGLHEFTLVEGDGGEIRLFGENGTQIQCYVKQNTLYVREVGGNKYEGEKKHTLILTVPKDTYWEEADIEADLATVDIHGLTAGKADISADMGSVVIESLSANEADISADLGSVEVKSAEIGKLDVSADLGSVEVAATVTGNVEAECDMGSITIELGNAPEDFNYIIETGMGSITVDGKAYSGRDGEQRVNNKAAQKMELETDMGSIDISFQ